MISNEMKVRVWYAPKGFGQFVDTLTIVSDGGTKQIVLLGNSRRPALIPSATALAFGSIAKGNPKVMELTITNSNVNKLNIDSIFTATKQFVVNRTSGSAMQNETLRVSIQFTADTFAVYSDTLFLRSNSAVRLVTIPLSGASPLPELSLIPVLCGKDTVAVGDTCTKVFVIKNTGVNELVYDSAGTRTESFVIQSAVSGTIKSNDSAVVTLVYIPKSFGEHNDTLTVLSFGRVTTMPLRGSSPYPEMTLSYASIDFGQVRRDTSAVKNLIVKNSSVNSLRIDSLNTSSSYFKTAKLPAPIFVTRNDSAVFAVTFSADTVRDCRDTLSIYTNQSASVVLLPLNGKGVLTSIKPFTDLIPDRYELSQNYPNPFNPSTTIRYGLPKNSMVSLKVYNILGQQVAQLVDGPQYAGWQSVEWRADVSSGIYFYRIEAAEGKNTFVQVKKMMLLK